MVKRKKELPEHPLFDFIKRADETARCAANPSSGSLDLDAEFRAAVSLDLKYAADADGREISRYQVAARMSELTGTEITKTMLDHWSAESQEKHRFPCQFLPAFVIGTGGQRRAFDVLSRRSGLFALPGPEALRAEIRRIEETIGRQQKERQKRIAFLKEIEQ